MVCYYPIDAHRSFDGSISFGSQIPYVNLRLPCGQCIGCRLEYSRIWAIRCLHEASLHESNCFVTLTYNDDCLPPGGSLCFKHFQDFMKRLRKRVSVKLRYFHCGEYGALLQRPHYHVLLFGYDFPDKKFWKRNRGNPLYTSEFLNSVWPYGYAPIGRVTFDSSAYVARYVLKKQRRCLKYGIDPYAGKQPEYTTMSRSPGIASDWFRKFFSDVYPSDYVVVNGRKVKPPRFYDKLLRDMDPVMYDSVKLLRRQAALRYEITHPGENSYARLSVREDCKRAQISSLLRPYESS